MSNTPEDRRLIGALLRIPFQAVVARIYEGLMEAGYSDMGPAHYVVFQHLPLEGMHLTELAERAQITKQSMGYLVDYLQERGYVERVPDPVDGRAKLVRYTERGRELYRVARQIVRRIEEDWACRLGEQKIEQLRQLLRELIAELEKDT
jgi:DNA-binding MarR family transcriptional regulator